MTLTEQQKQFFDTFGFLVFRQALAQDIGWITDEFEAVFQDRHMEHDPSRRTCLIPFIDQRERLCTLLDHPTILGIAKGVLGEDFNYVGGDGNFYTGDTQWHSDGFHTVGRFLKIALYLDPVGKDTGALRVIPGSHRIENRGRWDALKAGQSEELWGIPQSGVPAIALDTQPGDVVAFNHNLMHAAFGGSTRRRMFTLNCCRHAETPEELADVDRFVGGVSYLWLDSMYADAMKQTGPPSRMTHLRQVMEREAQMNLPAMAAKRRREMPAPARMG